MICAKCGRDNPGDTVSRRDACPGCGLELRTCVQCGFYAPGHYNDCCEPQAERVLNKDTANFCDYFRPANRAGTTPTDDPRAKAKAELDRLFAKKG